MNAKRNRLFIKKYEKVDTRFSYYFWWLSAPYIINPFRSLTHEIWYNKFVANEVIKQIPKLEIDKI